MVRIAILSLKKNATKFITAAKISATHSPFGPNIRPMISTSAVSVPRKTAVLTLL